MLNGSGLKIGTIVPKEDVEKYAASDLITHDGDLKPSIEKEVDNITYRIAFDREDYKIYQINTFDNNFATQDGYKVNSFIEVKKGEMTATATGAVVGSSTIDGWKTIIGTDYEITILSNNGEERLDLSHGSLSEKRAKISINKLFATHKSILAKIEQFSKFEYSIK
jgi:hypothetical protein